MPIFHHSKTHERFFFIHIPRTAGRFLTENFKKNGYRIEHHLTGEILKKEDVNNYLCERHDKTENGHAHYSHYNKWENIKGLPSIAVVRNPVDKFFSSSFFLAKEYGQSYLENWVNFKRIFLLKTKHKSSWELPQHEFISPRTKIWKYEKGFGKNFCEWINDILCINFSIKTSVYIKQNYDQSLRLIKTKPLINNIKKFYHKDFKNFNY